MPTGFWKKGAGLRPLYGIWVAVALLGAGTALMSSLCWKIRHDDAYVTFVFARHLGAGEGFVFNLGERVFGATSPLHVLLLALAYRLVGDGLPSAAIVVGAAGLSLQGLLLYALVRGFSPTLAMLLGLLAWAGMAGGPSWLALETNLFAASVLAVLWAHQARRPLLCGICLGLAFLCRYDGALLIPVLALEARWQKRPFPRREFLTAVVVVVPWLLAATIYFGSFLPQTLFAKKGSVGAWQYVAHYFLAITEQPMAVLFPGQPASCARILAPIGWISGLVFVFRHLPELRGFVLFSVLLLASYAAIGPHYAQYWHMYPLTLASSILLVVGTIGWLALGVGRRLREGKVRRPILLPLLPGLVLLLLTTAYSVSWSQDLDRSFWFGHRQRCYETVAAWIGEHAKPGQVFLANEVGTLGFLTRERMIDPYGLINDTNDYPRTRSPLALLGLIRHYRPTMVLADSLFEGRWLERDTNLRVVKVFPWTSPWSTLLVESPETSLRPGHPGGPERRPRTPVPDWP